HCDGWNVKLDDRRVSVFGLLPKLAADRVGNDADNRDRRCMGEPGLEGAAVIGPGTADPAQKVGDEAVVRLVVEDHRRGTRLGSVVHLDVVTAIASLE